MNSWSPSEAGGVSASLKKSSQVCHKDLIKKCDARNINKCSKTLFNIFVIDKRECYSSDKHIFSHLNKLFLLKILWSIHHTSPHSVILVAKIVCLLEGWAKYMCSWRMLMFSFLQTCKRNLCVRFILARANQEMGTSVPHVLGVKEIHPPKRSQRLRNLPWRQNFGEGVGPDDPPINVHGEKRGSPRLFKL